MYLMLGIECRYIFLEEPRLMNEQCVFETIKTCVSFKSVFSDFSPINDLAVFGYTVQEVTL